MNLSPLARLAQRTAVLGFVLFAAFAPHSIAGAEIAVAIVAAGWLVKTVLTGKTGFRGTTLDLPLWLLVLWTILSSLFSEEPQMSIPKLQSLWVVLLFYWTQAIVTRQTAIALVVVMILSGIAGTFYSAFDLFRGRGVVIESITDASPFHDTHILSGDTIWRIGRMRVYSAGDIDKIIRNTPVGSRLSVSVISRGEHVERPGFIVTNDLKNHPSPSGIAGVQRNHRFRASGWTRHYQTYAEILQILALLALGFGLAHFRNHGTNMRFNLALAALVVLIPGLILTSMRSVLVAFVAGATVMSLRVVRGKRRLLLTAAIAAVLGAGAVVVWQTRAQDALLLQDPSSSLRTEIARAGAARILVHPVFGHGMDSMKLHWTEWGFPGTDLSHLHSTPLQLAFDRGLPALALWLWLIAACWLLAFRSASRASDLGDTNRYAILLGSTGAIIAFFVSSLFNYNFGDGEVVLVFWWLMGIVVVLKRSIEEEQV